MLRRIIFKMRNKFMKCYLLFNWKRCIIVFTLQNFKDLKVWKSARYNHLLIHDTRKIKADWVWREIENFEYIRFIYPQLSNDKRCFAYTLYNMRNSEPVLFVSYHVLQCGLVWSSNSAGWRCSFYGEISRKQKSFSDWGTGPVCENPRCVRGLYFVCL
jgi:hypothetical protein